jgi:hypothetical protein
VESSGVVVGWASLNKNTSEVFFNFGVTSSKLPKLFLNYYTQLNSPLAKLSAVQ